MWKFLLEGEKKMKEKIKKLLKRILIKCVLNHLCDFIMLYIACVYPTHTIAIHILMTNPYSMMFFHFCIYRISIVVVNIIKQICIMYEKKINNNHD